MPDGQGAVPGAAAGSRVVPWIRRHRRMLAVCLPVLFTVLLLGLAEGALRLGGFGGYPRTFEIVGKLNDGSSLVMTDPDGPASYFFANRSGAMSLDIEAFRTPKPKGTVRVMWVGESAAKGIPQPRPLRAASFLQAMLSDAWPDRNVEVINLGTPGIASYPVLGIMTEALEHDPDLVVVYLGNNEFYGAFGVASLHTAGRSPTIIRLIRALHSTAIAQAVNKVIAKQAPTRAGTLMEAMVGQSTIGPEDPARAAAARTLESFVGDMIGRCRRRGVPVIVCTPPCNERDMAPLGEPDLTSLTGSQREELKGLLESARASLPGAPRDAENAARRAIEIHKHHATAYYLLGRALLASGLSDPAREQFVRAVDLDPMPWRPPTTSVAAIRRAAAARGAAVADLEQAFRAAAPHGSTGWELMDDHVHPSLRGQALVARTVVKAMTGLSGSMKLEQAALDRLANDQTYAARLGENPYETYAVATRMGMLGSISFFHRSNPEMTQRAEAVCGEIEAAAPAPVAAKLREWAQSTGDRVDRYPASAAAGLALVDMGRAAEAEPLFRTAAACADPYSSWRFEFVYRELEAKIAAKGALDPADIQLAADTIAECRAVIAAARSKSGGPELWAGRLYLLRGEASAAVVQLQAARERITGVNRVYVDDALVQALRAAGRAADADAVVREGLRGPYAAEYRRIQGR